LFEVAFSLVRSGFFSFGEFRLTQAPSVELGFTQNFQRLAYAREKLWQVSKGGPMHR